MQFLQDKSIGLHPKIRNNVLSICLFYGMLSLSPTHALGRELRKDQKSSAEEESARGGLLYPGEAGRVLLRQPGLGLPPRKASVGPSAEVRPGVTAIEASIQMLVPSEGAQLAQLLQRQRRNARMSDFMTLSRSEATDMPSSGPVSISFSCRTATGKNCFTCLSHLVRRTHAKC